ncbi:MAG: hypothetical protein ACI3XR_07545 [Eubacteriales bacterium]
MKQLFTIKSLIKVILLDIINLLFCANTFYILLFLTLPIAEMLPESFRESDIMNTIWLCAVFVVIVFVLGLLAIMLVDNIKLWIITLPIQFVLLVLVQVAPVGQQFAEGIIEQVLYAIVILSIQAVGVGMKLLYRKIKSRKKSVAKE